MLFWERGRKGPSDEQLKERIELDNTHNGGFDVFPEFSTSSEVPVLSVLGNCTTRLDESGGDHGKEERGDDQKTHVGLEGREEKRVVEWKEGRIKRKSKKGRVVG